MRSRKIAANDELLSTIHAILDPGAASFPRLVVAVLLLPDDSFKPLLADRCKQVVWCSLDVVANPDSLVRDHNQKQEHCSELLQRKLGDDTALPIRVIENVIA